MKKKNPKLKGWNSYILIEFITIFNSKLFFKSFFKSERILGMRSTRRIFLHFTLINLFISSYEILWIEGTS